MHPSCCIQGCVHVCVSVHVVLLAEAASPWDAWGFGVAMFGFRVDEHQMVFHGWISQCVCALHWDYLTLQ